MIKKIILTITVLILIILSLAGLLYILDIKVKKSQINYSLTDNDRQYTNYDVIRCNFPSLEYAFIDTYKANNFEIYFHKITKSDFFNTKSIDWDSNYIGGADIKNTTFPKLVKMVKEDCNQFKSGYIDYPGYKNLSDKEKTDKWNEISKTHLNWTYSPAPVQTASDRSFKIQYVGAIFYSMPKKAKKEFIKVYGDINSMDNNEIIKIYNKIEIGNNGELDERVLKVGLPEVFLNEWSEYTEVEKKKIINTYGEWKNLNKKEFYKYVKKIHDDARNDKFRLDD